MARQGDRLSLERDLNAGEISTNEPHEQTICFTVFQGGVHLTKDPAKVPELVTSMVGNRLITKQTPPDGIPVQKVMVAEAIDIVRETYFCILMDREFNGPVIVASPDGGMDIEEVAEKTPDR